jgi:WD40 repeat protein/DNA-binding SARP family transcriptional activator
MAQLSIFLLGSFRVALDGEPVTDFESDRVRALLAFLAVEAERAHRREALVGLLWPEHPERSARASLRNALANLRQVIGDREADPPFLCIARQTIGLDPDADAWVDVDQFRQQLAACKTHDHPPTETCPDCLPLLEEAVELYRDHFLVGFTLRDSAAFDDWQFFQTEGLKDQLAGALVRLANYHTSQGDFEPAIGYARRWLALDPLHEPAHRHLMVLYAQSNQRAAALRQYETCCQLLADELAVEPAEKTQETYERLLKGELPIGPAAVEAILERELRMVGECPYRGLSPFREADAPFFFGREAFTEPLAQAVRTRLIVAVIVGSSGSGKSSAVFAGLLPRLREEGDWLITDFRPGVQPFHTLAAALLPILEPGLSETDRLVETRKLADALRERRVPLYNVVERALDKSTGSNRLLLLVDQFEELYSLCPEPEVRRCFVDLLLAAVEAVEERRDSPFVLLLTMRADFMGQAVAYRPFADALQETALILGPMTREELRAAIERPADMQGAALEAGLVDRLLDDVGEEPGNLPLLEFALTLLWERLDYGWMTHRAYEEIGRVEGALARYAEEVYGALAEGEREGARRVFVQLVQPGERTEDTRRLATRAELGEENWALVQHLADRRLVVTGREKTTGSETVEVVHEALIQRWGQLQDWMEEDRAFRTWQERLRAALGQWQTMGQDEGVLLRGAPLAEAEGWLAEREGELSTGEKAFIQTSVELRERRETERERRRRWIFVGLAAGLIVALVLALLAVSQWQRAEAEARRAETEEQQALVQASIGLAGQALLELEGPSPERSVPLALELLESYPYTWQAEQALGQAVLGSRLRLTLQHEAQVNAAQWSPDGTRIVTGGGDGTARVWDASASSPTYGEELLTISGHQGAVESVMWSPSGDRILTAGGEDRTAKVWDASASSPTYGEELLKLTGHTDVVYSARWSPDGTRIVTASDDRAKIWDASASSLRYGEVLLTLPGPSGWATMSAVWSPSGEHILTTHGDDTAMVWDASASSPTYGDPLLTLSGHTSTVMAGSWSSDGLHIVTASLDGTAKVWDATTGAEIVTLSGHKAEVWAVAWSSDGLHIVTGSGDGTVKVWDASASSPTYGGEIISLIAHTSDVYGVAWSPDGDQIVTVSWDGTAKVWNLDPTYLTTTDSPGVVSWKGVAWSPQGDRVSRGFLNDSTGKVWDVSVSSPTYGEELFVLSYPGFAGLYQIAWSPSGDRILTAHGNDGIRMWDAASGKRLRFYSPGGAHCAEWSPDGTLIVTASFSDKYVRILDAETGEMLSAFTGDEGYVYDVAWSPDGANIATAGESGTARIWDAATGQLIRDLYPESLGVAVSGVAWSPDGRRVATYADNGIGGVWDAAASSPTYGQELVTFSGHTGRARVHWSRTGERILTTGQDGTARVWDANTGVELLRYPGISAAWSPDGKRIATASADGTLKVFPAWQTTQELVDYARECCVVRELTAEEREQFGLSPR